jgi:hypothetical protein
MSDDRINPELSDVELDEAELSNVSAGKPFTGFGDIMGESTDKDHKDWVTLFQY